MTWDIRYGDKTQVWVTDNPEQDNVSIELSDLRGLVFQLRESQSSLHDRIYQMEQDNLSLMKNQVIITELLEKIHLNQRGRLKL